jgi:hypothetical protein
VKTLFEEAFSVKTLFEIAITMVYEPRAGECAKANILTNTIYPRRSVEDATAQSTVTLIAENDININREVQRCYTFYVEDDEICYSILYFFIKYRNVDTMLFWRTKIGYRTTTLGTKLGTCLLFLATRAEKKTSHYVNKHTYRNLRQPYILSYQTDPHPNGLIP